MAWFIPAIMALGHGAAAAGEAVAHGAAAAGEAVGHGAEAAGQGIEHGAQAVGSKFGIGGGGESAGASMPSGGAAASDGSPSAAMSAAGNDGSSAASNLGIGPKSPSFLDKADAFMKRPSVKQTNQSLTGLMNAAGKDSGVSNSQSSTPIENPIAPSPSFPGGDSAMPQALMPGAMDEPFGAPGRRALSDTLSRNGG
jgi:hypothetical protein